MNIPATIFMLFALQSIFLGGVTALEYYKKGEKIDTMKLVIVILCIVITGISFGVWQKQ